MKKAEIIFGAIISIGFVFRLMHWPFASIILTIGTLLLSILYTFFGFALLNNLGLRESFKSESFKHISKLRILGTIVTGMVLGLLVIYMLFKIQFWPYGDIGLQQGLILLSIIFVIAIAFYLNNRKQFLKLNYKRLTFIGIISILIYLISLDQLVDLYYGSDSKYAEEYKIYLKDESPDAQRPLREFNSNNDEE